jgi:hypothetical protein
VFSDRGLVGAGWRVRRLDRRPATPSRNVACHIANRSGPITVHRIGGGAAKQKSFGKRDSPSLRGE